MRVYGYGAYWIVLFPFFLLVAYIVKLVNYFRGVGTLKSVVVLGLLFYLTMTILTFFTCYYSICFSDRGCICIDFWTWHEVFEKGVLNVQPVG